MEHAMFIPLSTQRFSSPVSEFSPGPDTFLEWIETDRFVVNVTYQRESGRRGATNVNQIAEKFRLVEVRSRHSGAGRGRSVCHRRWTAPNNRGDPAGPGKSSLSGRA